MAAGTDAVGCWASAAGAIGATDCAAAACAEAGACGPASVWPIGFSARSDSEVISIRGGVAAVSPERGCAAADSLAATAGRAAGSGEAGAGCGAAIGLSARSD
ncbi:MAG: hypothetical protein ACLGHB_10020, partial [Gammaproteobacteria bacterium]